MPNNENVIDQLEALMQSGDEAAARKFIIEHFSEFPVEAQRDLAVELFSDAMENDLAERKRIVELKKEFLDVVEKLDEGGNGN